MEALRKELGTLASEMMLDGALRGEGRSPVIEPRRGGTEVDTADACCGYAYAYKGKRGGFDDY
jgi:hypothetical protein